MTIYTVNFLSNCISHFTHSNLRHANFNHGTWQQVYTIASEEAKNHDSHDKELKECSLPLMYHAE